MHVPDFATSAGGITTFALPLLISSVTLTFEMNVNPDGVRGEGRAACSRNLTWSCGAGAVFVQENPLRDKGESVTGHRHEIERLETEIHRIVFKQAAHDGAQQIHGHDPGDVAPSREQCREHNS
jgi:hypothetical protein